MLTPASPINAQKVDAMAGFSLKCGPYIPKTLTLSVFTIFKEFTNLGYTFKEMEHNQHNSLCCGVNSWMNCNEKSKALRYKRMLEAKEAGEIMITSCPKCEIHLNCLQNDFEDIASVEIIDFSEFLLKHIKIIDKKNTEGVKK